MPTPHEQARLREGMRLHPHCSTHRWRAYFQYLLGRMVTLDETEQFLKDEALNVATCMTGVR